MKLAHCKRCGEIVGNHKRYINTYLFCERCWWRWQGNSKSRNYIEFDEWIKKRTKATKKVGI